MMKCKFCQFNSATRRSLLMHYKLDHIHNQHMSSWPCVIETCSMTFQNYASLRGHLTRCHSVINKMSENLVLVCDNCNGSIHDLSSYLKHLRNHVSSNETVKCPFLESASSPCSFSSNVSSTFRSHLSRCHFNATITNIQEKFVRRSTPDVSFNEGPTANNASTALADQSADEFDLIDNLDDFPDQSEVEADYNEKVTRLLLLSFIKMQCILNLPISAVQEIIDDFYNIKTLSVPVVSQQLALSLQPYNIPAEVIQQLAKDLHAGDPFVKSFSHEGQFGSHNKRLSAAKQLLPYVAPKEINLGCVDGIQHKFVYVSVLETLQALMNRVDVLNAIMHSTVPIPYVYRHYNDGSLCKSHPLFFENEHYLKIALYCDEWESANPLGTNRKKHKVLAFYWSLLNIDAKYRSALHTIQLAILCNANDAREHFGYADILRPLLQDLSLLEDHGIYIEKLGQCLKGALVYVAADNLGAHSIGGYVENFSRRGCICRQCKFRGEDLEKTRDCCCIDFKLRSKLEYCRNVQQARADKSTVKKHGVKRDSELHSELQFFHVTSGLPQDVFHDLLEGIVPYELAISMDYFIKSKCFSEVYLRRRLAQLQLKYSDKTSRPVLSVTFMRSRTVGGNMSKNWTFIRLLPLFIGHKVKCDDNVWLMLMALKDIVELACSPVHTEESICLLASKIADHKKLFNNSFPNLPMKPKHHYLEHYPDQIRQFGPLVACSTIRYEGKHNYFKQIIHRTKNFKNILMTLSERHQLLQAYYLASTHYFKSEVSFISQHDISLHLLSPSVKLALEQSLGQALYSVEARLSMADACIVFGTKYLRHLFVTCGFAGCLPYYSEIVEICGVSEEPYVIVKPYEVAYSEDFHCYMLIDSKNELKCVKVKSLVDHYPLPAYQIDRRWYIFPKHFVLESAGNI